MKTLGSFENQLSVEAGLADEIFRTVVGVMGEGVVVHNHDGEIVYANACAERILGLSIEQMRGTKPLDPLWRLVRRDGVTAEPDDIPSEVVRKTGKSCRDVVLGVAVGSSSVVWLKVSCDPVKNEIDGGLRFAIATFSDITFEINANAALVRSEQLLRIALEKADAANKAKTIFLAMMSHELRTPLNAILGFSEIMHEQMFGPIGNSRYLEYLGDVKHSAAHLLDLISEVLEMSQLEAGRFTPSIEPVFAADIWRTVFSMMGHEATKRGVKLLPDIDDGLIFAGDRRAVIQVLANVVGNAVKYAPHATVTIRIKRTNQGRRMECTVDDNGPGIPPAAMINITQPFTPNGDAYVSRKGGVGLGLAICRSLLTQMNGTFEINSEVGKGTVVTFSLPVVNEFGGVEVGSS